MFFYKVNKEMLYNQVSILPGQTSRQSTPYSGIKPFEIIAVPAFIYIFVSRQIQLLMTNGNSKPVKILVICTGNSCRSQMAEGFLKSFDKTLEVFSAGTMPWIRVNARAIRVMSEAGIDISNSYPKSVDLFLDKEWDFVITVCDKAKEACPVFSGKVHHRLHLGFEDPTFVSGTEDYIMGEFRRVRDKMKKELYNFYISLKR